ncbi:MAG: ATP-grasp domain-containing protein, partial [Legionella sp.]
KQQEFAIEWINRNAKIKNWRVVLADTVAAHAFLFSIKKQLNIAAYAPSSDVLLNECHNKWLFYQRLRNAGIPTPKSLLISNLELLDEQFINEIGFPLIVKPLNASASSGIFRFNDYKSLSMYLRSPGPYKELPLIAQTFIEGDSLSSSFIALDGDILSANVDLHNKDKSYTFVNEPHILKMTQNIIKEFHYGGPGNIDFIQDKITKQTYALEFNCRFWLTVHLSEWHGVNFPDLAAKTCLGQKISESVTTPGQVFFPSVLFRLLKHPSMLRKIDLANWKGIWRSISDPLPQLFRALKK